MGLLRVGAMNGLAVVPKCGLGEAFRVGKVLGWAGSFSTSGCTKNTNARKGVHKSEAFSIAPIPQHRLRVEFGQSFLVIGHSKNGRA